MSFIERAWILVGVALMVGCGSTNRDTLDDDDDDDGVQGCTAMGCDDGLTVAFSAKQVGEYSFHVVADGQLTTCAATLPLPPCEQSTPNCSRPEVSLFESGCALAPAGHSLEGISLLGAHPATVEVTAYRDGMEIARETFTPEYQRVAPNGEECGPICEQATVDFAMGP